MLEDCAGAWLQSAAHLGHDAQAGCKAVQLTAYLQVLGVPTDEERRSPSRAAESPGSMRQPGRWPGWACDSAS